MTTQHDLTPYLPALLDALGSFNVPTLLICEERGVYTRKYANRAAAALFGYTLEEYMARDPLADIVPDERGLMQALADNFRAGQAIPATLEITGLHRDGRPLPLEVSTGRLQLGNIQVFAVLMREVSTSSRDRLSLLEEDRIALVGALAAGFAHETNNPLTSVLLNLRFLRRQLGELPSPQQLQAVRVVDDVTVAAERIASNVRAFQTLATRSTPQTVDLAAIVSSALRLVAPTVEPRAKVERQIEPVCAVTGEESRIGQAVLAMMLFASSGFDETSGTTNRIVVVVEERGGGVVVEVSDNGHALTDDEARNAFDPFFRSPSGARGAGIGVGLAVARSVATALGGEVTLAPRLGGGAVITMRLPSAKAVPCG